MASEVSNSPAPFSINVAEEKLSELRTKLEAAVYPDELEDPGKAYGVPLKDIQRLVSYWKERFDWRAQETKLNQLPQFKLSVPVDGGFGPLNIHFVHLRSSTRGAIPLIFVHGWPGHFNEVSKILPLLTSGDPPHFHVVAPSLPNFGFSQGVRKKGFSIKQYAEVCHRLMLALGYRDYVTQGGDWGYMVTRAMGYLYPDHCKASHINTPVMEPPSLTASPLIWLQQLISGLSLWDEQALQRSGAYAAEGSGYMVLQSSKPQTIGYALSDSPVALLAWVYEKLYDWTDDYSWTDDEVLTWVSLYWFSTAGPAASLRIYYEHAHDTQIPMRRIRSGWIPQVKYGVAYMPKEILACPKLWVRQMGYVVHEGDAEKGAHFAAWENPTFLAKDIKRMFSKNGGAFGVVPSQNGY